jgi:hypothetical protein
MPEYRKKPQIGKADPATRPQADDPAGCVWMLVAAVVAYFVLSSVSRVLFHIASKLDQLICDGALALFLVMLLVGIVFQMRDWNAKARAKTAWAGACIRAEVRIVGRRPAGGFEMYDRYHHVSAHVELEMNADQRALAPLATSVSVDIPDTLYTRLADRDTVRIYYSPDAPLEFLLEEEL